MVQKSLPVDVASVGRTQELNIHRKDIGVISAIGLIVNKMIGTGIFSTPSSIIRLAGSPGLALVLWAIGALVALAGLYTYLEFGSMLPENGGEINYLQYTYRKPRYLILTAYCVQLVVLGNGNGVAFGLYICEAAGIDPGRWNMRLIGLAGTTFAFLSNAMGGKYSLYLQNLLGIFKIVILAMVVVAGWVGWGGGANIPPTHSFHDSFGGNASAYGVVTAVFSIMFSYSGYSNANYALGETRNPQRVLKIAAPLALLLVSILYLLANISYFGVLTPEEIKNSKNIVAADFFGRLWGYKARKAVSVFVALSTLGNLMAVTYTNSRVVQALARDGILPFSSLLGSSLPFNSPFFALIEQWLMSIWVIFAPPPGDAYNFVVNLGTYPQAIFNAFTAFGLILIYSRKNYYPDWNPSIRATLPVVVFFFLANLYLCAAPWVPPETASQNIYRQIPYYMQNVVGLALFGLGIVYWLVRFCILPKIGDYHILTEEYTDFNGWRHHVIRSAPNSDQRHVQKTGPVLRWWKNTCSVVVTQGERVSKFWDRWINDSDPVPLWLEHIRTSLSARLGFDQNESITVYGDTKQYPKLSLTNSASA